MTARWVEEVGQHVWIVCVVPGPWSVYVRHNFIADFDSHDEARR